MASQSYTDVMNFLNNTAAGRTIDTIADFIPFLGTAKDLGLGAWSLGEGDNTEGIARLLGGAAGAVVPFGIGKIGKKLAKGGIKAGTSAVAKGLAKEGVETIAEQAVKQGIKEAAESGVEQVAKKGIKGTLASGGSKIAPFLERAGKLNPYTSWGDVISKGAAQGISSNFAENTVKQTDADLKQQAETADIMNSDLVTGKYLDTLLNDLNTETTSEYDKYAQELARKEEQDKASAVYSGMNAGNIGLSNLLKGNIGNAYNQLSKQALNEMTKQKSSNRLNAMSQTDNQFNSLLSLAQNTGNNDLLEKLLLAKTNQLTKGN